MSTTFVQKLERGQERKQRREDRQRKQMQRLNGVLKIKRKRRRHSE